MIWIDFYRNIVAVLYFDVLERLKHHRRYHFNRIHKRCGYLFENLFNIYLLFFCVMTKEQEKNKK